MVCISKKNTKDILFEVADVFSKTGIECVEAFFQKECVIKSKWTVVNQLNCKFDCVLTLGCANDEYQSILAIGIQNSSFTALTGEENISVEDASDILGEFANTYCGMLSDHSEFYENFGVLAQTLPIFYRQGQSFLNFIWGVEGKLFFNDNWIYFGYAIRKI
jgi:hypothetical protein